jgi:Flp pilus assembly protein TadG
MLRAVARRRRGHPNAERGQSVVEFALIFPVFILLVIGLIEFAVTFGIMLNVNYASRAAALLAAEVGNRTGADCIILNAVDESLSGVSNKAEIEEIRIYWADANGVELAANVYERGGPTTCTFSSGTTLTVPYTSILLNYPDAVRCTVLAGCGGAHDGLDTIGVTIEFHHSWLTPLPNLVQVPPAGLTFTRSNTMRMEPTL